MAIANINGFDVPYVHAVSIDRYVIADRARTAGGKLRQDAITLKRTWSLETRPMTRLEAQGLIDEVERLFGGPMDFWLDEFGAQSNTVRAFVTIDDEQRVTFAKDGVWHNDGKQLVFTIEEQ